jgi:hypothetical protein
MQLGYWLYYDKQSQEQKKKDDPDNLAKLELENKLVEECPCRCECSWYGCYEKVIIATLGIISIVFVILYFTLLRYAKLGNELKSMIVNKDLLEKGSQLLNMDLKELSESIGEMF